MPGVCEVGRWVVVMVAGPEAPVGRTGEDQCEWWPLAGCEVFAAAMHDPVRVTQAGGGEGGAALINLAAGCVTAQPLGRDQGGAETAERVDEPVSGGRSNAR